MGTKKPKPILEGTIRIKTKDLKPYEKTKSSWKLSPEKFPEILRIVTLFKAHKKFDFLVDKKDSTFLKGQLSPERKCQGARINILPDGRQLDKAYSLFAKDLTIHDETSNTHWDVLYQNPGGTYSYVYTLEKRASSISKKYREVEDFEKRYPLLRKKVLAALNNPKDDFAVPMFTLLETRMRIGNEIYYKAHGHKGLTTLRKGDVSVKGSEVAFSYLSKGGVPRNITVAFPAIYIRRLKKLLKRRGEFVFSTRTGHPLTDMQFKEAFRKYCGKGFYPHIVRSYYATKKAKDFLGEHEKATKKEIRDFFTLLAESLGHKKFSKKDQIWKDSYTVTIHSYIQPEVLEKIQSLSERKV